MKGAVAFAQQQGDIGDNTLENGFAYDQIGLAVAVEVAQRHPRSATKSGRNKVGALKGSTAQAQQH